MSEQIQDLIASEIHLTNVLTCARFSVPASLAGMKYLAVDADELARRCAHVQDEMRKQYRELVEGENDAAVLFREFGDSAELFTRIGRATRLLHVDDLSLNDFISVFGLPQDEAVKLRVVERGQKFLGDIPESGSQPGDVSATILDAELLAKYQMLDRALDLLNRAISNNPNPIPFLEKGFFLCGEYGRRDRQMAFALPLAKLLQAQGQNERAAYFLNEARRSDVPTPSPAVRKSVTSKPAKNGQPDFLESVSAPVLDDPDVILVSRTSKVSIFEIIQMIENSRYTAVIDISGTEADGQIRFNAGAIADAETLAGVRGQDALRSFVSLQTGFMSVKIVDQEFDPTITASSNTSLVLDLLREIDEAQNADEEISSFA